MSTKLGRTIRRKEGIFRRSFDPYRDGWQGATESSELRCCKEILCLKKENQDENTKRASKKKMIKVKTRKGRLD